MHRDYQVHQRVGHGAYGSVYEAQRQADQKHESRYVMKVVPLDVNIPTEDCMPHEPDTWRDCLQESTAAFNEEVEVSTRMGQLGIGPKVYSAWMCENVDALLYYAFTNGKPILHLEVYYLHCSFIKLSGVQTYSLHVYPELSTVQFAQS